MNWTPWIETTWHCIACFVLKLRKQCGQAKGSSPVWTRTWLTMFVEKWAWWPHWPQTQTGSIFPWFPPTTLNPFQMGTAPSRQSETLSSWEHQIYFWQTKIMTMIGCIFVTKDYWYEIFQIWQKLVRWTIPNWAFFFLSLAGEPGREQNSIAFQIQYKKILHLSLKLQSFANC